MIAVDSSTWIAFFHGVDGADVEALDRLLEARQVVLPPVVLTELLSDPKLPKEAEKALLDLPLLEAEQGYWERAGRLRANLLKRRAKARLADALIAQSCIDHAVSLLTRDGDFARFQRFGGLRLVS